MLPEPALLDEFRPTGRLTGSARPAPGWREDLRRIPDLRNALAIVTTYAQTIGIVWFALWADHPVVWVAAFVLMGRAHAQFAALMHEAAHRLLFRNKG